MTVHPNGRLKEPMTLLGSITIHLRYCLVWNLCSITISLKGTSDFGRRGEYLNLGIVSLDS